jgi:MoaA/NifB/PqqE/SkfB family radical SAM enzyme
MRMDGIESVNGSKYRQKLNVLWNLTKRCNFDCSYCTSAFHDNYSKPIPIELLKKAVDKIISTVNGNRRNAHFTFVGGEPTVHPKFKDLLLYINDNRQGDQIGIQTNFTRPNKWFMDLYEETILSTLNVSLHFEYEWEKMANKMIEFDLFTRRFRGQIGYAETGLVVNVMAHKDYKAELEKAIKLFNTYNVKYVIRKVRNPRDVGPGEYSTLEQYDDSYYEDNEYPYWIDSNNPKFNHKYRFIEIREDNENKLVHPNEIMKRKKNYFKGWKCDVGIRTMVIGFDGEVFGAHCGVGGSLGNVYDDSILKLKTEPTICTANYCDCTFDISISKVK